MPTLVRGLVIFGWIMSTVLVLKIDLWIAVLMPILLRTPIQKMLDCGVIREVKDSSMHSYVRDCFC